MDTLYILYGHASALPEVDYDENIRREQEAIDEYPNYMFIDNIGKEGFEDVFKTFVNDLKYQEDISKMKDICMNVFDKLVEIYDYELPYDLNLNDKTQIYNLINFVAFLEFDNVEFLSSIWNELLEDIQDLKNLDLASFCNENKDIIHEQVEGNTKSYVYDEIITTFLRTYSKLLDWFVERTEKYKFTVIFNVLTGGLNSYGKSSN